MAATPEKDSSRDCAAREEDEHGRRETRSMTGVYESHDQTSKGEAISLAHQMERPETAAGTPAFSALLYFVAVPAPTPSFDFTPPALSPWSIAKGRRGGPRRRSRY